MDFRFLHEFFMQSDIHKNSINFFDDTDFIKNNRCTGMAGTGI
jgi:hypothetical protein